MRKPYHSFQPGLLVVLLCLIGFDSLAQLQGSSYAQAKQSGSAKFYYVYDGVAGFADKSQSGIVTGLLVDMMGQFEDYLKEKKGIDVSVEFVYAKDGDFQTFMNHVRTGKGGVFGLSNISISAERKRNYSFSPPFLDNVTVLLSNAKSDNVTAMENISIAFDGMTAYSLEGSTYYKRLSEIKSTYFPAMKIVNLSSGVELIDKLKTDEKSFAILDLNYYLEVLMQKHPIKRHPVGDQKDDQFGIIMPKNSDWEPLLRDFMNTEILGTSNYSRIIVDNLGSSALRLLDSVKN